MIEGKEEGFGVRPGLNVGLATWLCCGPLGMSLSHDVRGKEREERVEREGERREGGRGEGGQRETVGRGVEGSGGERERGR